MTHDFCHRVLWALDFAQGLLLPTETWERFLKQPRSAFQTSPSAKRTEKNRFSGVLRTITHKTPPADRDRIERSPRSLTARESKQCAAPKRRVFERPRLPEPQVREDRSHHRRILDQRNHPHRALALAAHERVSFVDFADQPRPGQLRAARVLTKHFNDAAGRSRHRSGDLRLARSATAARVPAHVPDELLVAIGNMLAKQLQPQGTRHRLEVALEPKMHLRAVDHGARSRAGLDRGARRGVPAARRGAL